MSDKLPTYDQIQLLLEPQPISGTPPPADQDSPMGAQPFQSSLEPLMEDPLLEDALQAEASLQQFPTAEFQSMDDLAAVDKLSDIMEEDEYESSMDEEENTDGDEEDNGSMSTEESTADDALELPPTEEQDEIALAEGMEFSSTDDLFLEGLAFLFEEDVEFEEFQPAYEDAEIVEFAQFIPAQQDETDESEEYISTEEQIEIIEFDEDYQSPVELDMTEELEEVPAAEEQDETEESAPTDEKAALVPHQMQTTTANGSEDLAIEGSVRDCITGTLMFLLLTPMFVCCLFIATVMVIYNTCDSM